jgi:fatty-acid desaturase
MQTVNVRTVLETAVLGKLDQLTHDVTRTYYCYRLARRVLILAVVVLGEERERDVYDQ